MKLFSYVLRFDDGAAPNPFWGYCTLTICKPVIRRTAKVGDWVVGWGSKNGRQNGEPHDFQDHVVYAMKVTKVMTLKQYDKWCAKYVPKKIPDMQSKDYSRRAGDCIYEYSPRKKEPKLRLGVHSKLSRVRDLGGKNALVSDHFYYFGEKAVSIRSKDEFLELVKRNQGHKKIHDGPLVHKFVKWLEKKYKRNKLYGKPQMPVSSNAATRRACAKQCFADDAYDDEVVVKL